MLTAETRVSMPIAENFLRSILIWICEPYSIHEIDYQASFSCSSFAAVTSEPTLHGRSLDERSEGKKGLYEEIHKYKECEYIVQRYVRRTGRVIQRFRKKLMKRSTTVDTRNGSSTRSVTIPTTLSTALRSSAEGGVIRPQSTVTEEK